MLRELAVVDQVPVYHNADAESLPEAIVDRIVNGTVDWITLTSSAITTRLHDLLPEPARQRIGREVRLASISPGHFRDGPTPGLRTSRPRRPNSPGKGWWPP